MMKIIEKFGFWIILAVAVVLRFINITKQSIWHDEGYTALMVEQGIADITKTTAIDVHPPLYYYLLHYWSLLFGDTEMALRSMSAFFGVGVIVLVYLIAKKIFGSRVALIAMLLATFSPYILRYSQEARMYGVEGFWTMLATYALFLALEVKKAGSSILRAKQSGVEKFKDVSSRFILLTRTINANKYWGLYIVSMSAAMYTHYYAFFLVFVHWIYVFIRSFGEKERPILKLKWWLSNVAIALLFIPWVPNVLKQFSKVQGAYWIPPVDLLTIPATALNSITYHIPRPLADLFSGKTAILALIIIIIFLTIIAFSIYKNKEKTKEIALFALYFLIPTGIVFILSVVKQPVFQERYFVFAMPGIYILLAIFIASLKNRLLKIAIIIIILGGMIHGIYLVYAEARHAMDKPAAIINSEFSPGDGLAVGELYAYLDFDFYNKTGQRAKLVDAGNISNNNEMAFIYPYRDELVRKNWEEVENTTGTVWVIGKPDKDYYKSIPANWVLEKSEKFEDSEVRKYSVN